MPRPCHLGLTGGIGSGKSTVAKMLVGLGAHLVDADAISRNLTAAGGAAIGPIRAEFGDAAIDNTGAMHRDAMRALIFSDGSAKTRLEAIIHPLVREVGAQAVRNSSSNFIVHDIPLLVESGRSRASFDSILVVDCTETTQVERVVARSGSTQVQVRQVIANQASRAQRLQAADHVVFNDGIDLQQLHWCVKSVAELVGMPSTVGMIRP